MNTDSIKNYIFKNFNKVKINSKDIIPGDIFVALPGENFHGSMFIEESLKNGAKFVITDELDGNENFDNNIIYVKNIFDYLVSISLEKREIYKGKVIGITGSIGKTSVKENLNYFLGNFCKVSASIKSYNNLLGVILSILNLDINSSYAIFEIGTNNFNEIKKLTKIIQPSQIVITNIYPSHLEKLINTKNIAKEKSDIFNPSYNKNTELVILSNNNDDENIIFQKVIKLNLCKVYSISENSKSDLKNVKIKSIDNMHSEVNFKYRNNQICFKIPSSQVPRIDNILMCFCIFDFNKISLDIFKSLSVDVPLIEGRGLKTNIILNKKKIIFIDESYNASPKSMKVAIDYFSKLRIRNNQKKFLILADMKELGNESIRYHEELLNYVYDRKLENIIICGEIMEIVFNKVKNKGYKLMLDKKAILHYLEKNLNNNDIILIKGSNSSLSNEIAKDLLKRRVN